MRWQLHENFYIVSKLNKLWFTNGLKLDRHFYPPYVNSAFYWIARFRRWTPAKGTQPNVVKRWTVNRANNLPWNSWGHLALKIRGQKFYICSVFRRLRDLMANICWTKRSIHDRARELEVRRVSYTVPKFHELWSTNGLTPDRSYTHPHCFVCPSPSHTLYASLT